MAKYEYRIPLTCPLPKQNSVGTGDGGWHHIPWTRESRAEAMKTHTRLATRAQYNQYLFRLGRPPV